MPHANGEVQTCTGCTLAHAYCCNATHNVLNYRARSGSPHCGKRPLLNLRLASRYPGFRQRSSLRQPQPVMREQQTHVRCGTRKQARHADCSLRAQCSGWATVPPAMQFAESGEAERARTDADGGRTGGGGQTGLACHRVRSRQASAVCTAKRRPCQNDRGESGTCESRLSSPVCAAKELAHTASRTANHHQRDVGVGPWTRGCGSFHYEKGATCKFGDF